ncbi:nitrate- and nitrite sensing domain-containing protein [Streptomyces sp. NPDC095602]|uniref:sensor histidine kinase n=1 Tax=Streptomyces sp. NPDC095602 TaxID=3155819 RepID=UPI0033338097
MRSPRTPDGADTPAAPPPAPSPRDASRSPRGRRAHAAPPPPAEHRDRPTRTREPGERTARPPGGLHEPRERHVRGVRGEPRLPWRLPRARTVRARVIALLMVPVVALLTLWGFATVTTAQDIAHLRAARSAEQRVGEPVRAAVTALQEERRAAVRQAAAPGTVHAGELRQRARRTDALVARLRLGGRHTTADTGDLPLEVADRLRRFVDETARLKPLRLQAQAPASRPTTRSRAAGTAGLLHDGYTDIIAAAHDVQGALTRLPDLPDGASARVLLDLNRAAELLAQEDALLTTAHLTGSFPAERRRDFTGAAEARRVLLRGATADLPVPARTAWRRLADGSAYQRLTAAEEAVAKASTARRAAAAAPATTWDPAHTAIRARLAALEDDARRASADRADPLVGGALTPAGAAVLLGFAAVAAALVISVRIGRALVVELVGLRDSALDIAHRRLPDAMRRLRAGEELDIHAEAPQAPPTHDEIGQVAAALSTVHGAALNAAVERAELADGISGVFVNLARRSQVLVHRQLHLLDSMERRADDPNELGDLFRLDHLTTRMRRHAESLIILSGSAPGRAWRTLVPLTNVVRAAVSEIEDYARVEVHPLPETAVTGGAVADLTHLLAELLENAAQFSPPHTKVRVTGEPVGSGYALEVEDRGLGMSPQALADANRRIAGSESLDLFDSDRLGLFVVSRLAVRHDIKVQLRTSAYGGTTAVVLLPTDLLQGTLPVREPARRPTPRAQDSTPAPGPQDSSTPIPRLRDGAPAPYPRDGATAPHVRDSAPAPHARDSAPAAPPAARLRPTAPPHTPAHPHAQGAAASARPPAAALPARDRGPGHAPEPRPAGDGLPRRVRQAGLAPQLRQARPAPQDPPPHPPADDPPERTPEQVRDRMAAYRAGWARGRGPAPGPAAARPPLPGTAAGSGRSHPHGSEGDAR